MKRYIKPEAELLRAWAECNEKHASIVYPMGMGGERFNVKTTDEAGETGFVNAGKDTDWGKVGFDLWDD